MSERTREEERLHKQRQRARRRDEHAHEVIQLHPGTQGEGVVMDDIPPAGEFEARVQRELDALGELVTDRMPGQAGNALAMARILDNPMMLVQHPAASGQLRAALLALHEAAKSSARTTGKVRMLRSRHVG